MFNYKKAERLFRERRKEVFKVIFLFFLWWLLSIILFLNRFHYGFHISCLVVIFCLYIIIKILNPVKLQWIKSTREIASFRDCPKLWSSFSFFYPNNRQLPVLFLVDTRDLFAINYSTSFFRKTKTFISEGLIDNLSGEELKSALGHEIGHFRHKDIPLICLVNFFISGIYFFSGLTILSCIDVFVSIFSPSSAISVFVLMLVFIFLFLVFATFLFSPFLIFIKAYLSQQMEYAADMFAAKETKNPEALAVALIKIKGLPQLIIQMNPHRKWLKKIDEAFSSHPTVKKRVFLLMSLYDK